MCFDSETGFRVWFGGWLDFFINFQSYPESSEELVVKIPSQWSSLYAPAEPARYNPDLFFIEMKRCKYVCIPPLKASYF